MSTMTVSRLKEAGFYVVKDTVTNSKELIDAIHYLDFLAQNNSVDVGSLEVPIDGNEFKLTKSELTKLFFGHIEAKKEAIRSAIVPIPEQNMAAIKTVMDQLAGRARARLLDEVTGSRLNAERSMNQALAYLAQARIKEMEVQAMQNPDSSPQMQEMIAGLPSTNWNFHSFNGYEKELRFITRSDVILTHRVPAAGLTYDLNCGKLIVYIRLTDFRVKVVGGPGAIDYEESDGSYVHPHVSSGHTVCWGNASNTAVEAIVKGDIIKILNILDALLPNYGEQPYIGIEEFSKSIKRRDARLRGLREQKEKSPELDLGDYGAQEWVKFDDEEEVEEEPEEDEDYQDHDSDEDSDSDEDGGEDDNNE